MSQRPKAVETECAGCGAVMTWPDDGSLPVCSFRCDRTLVGEAAAAREWPVEAAYAMCTEGRKHLEIAEATGLDLSAVEQISAAQQNESTLGDVLRFFSEATGETSPYGPWDVQFGDHDVMRNDGSPEAKTAKKMHTWLSGLTVKSIIPGSTPGWILIEFVPDSEKLKELVAQPEAVKRLFLTVWVGEQRKFDPGYEHEWDMALHLNVETGGGLIAPHVPFMGGKSGGVTYEMGLE